MNAFRTSGPGIWTRVLPSRGRAIGVTIMVSMGIGLVTIIYGMFAGWGDHTSRGFDHTFPVQGVSTMRDTSSGYGGYPLMSWTITRTPAGRPAAFGITPDGQIVSMWFSGLSG